MYQESIRRMIPRAKKYLDRKPRLFFCYCSLPSDLDMPYLDIPEGCVLVGPQNSQFLKIFSDRILTGFVLMVPGPFRKKR